MDTRRFDQIEHALVCCRTDGRQVIQEFQEFSPSGERAEGQFASYPRMHKDGILVQEPHKPRVVLVNVIYLDAHIYENHRPRSLLGAEGGSLRRGTTFASGSLPPDAASSTRASRAIRARNPSRTTSLILSRPDASRASATRSSDNINVALKHINMTK